MVRRGNVLIYRHERADALIDPASPLSAVAKEGCVEVRGAVPILSSIKNLSLSYLKNFNTCLIYMRL